MPGTCIKSLAFLSSTALGVRGSVSLKKKHRQSPRGVPLKVKGQNPNSKPGRRHPVPWPSPTLKPSRQYFPPRLFLFLSHPNELPKEYRARFRFQGPKSFQLHSYILGNWWMDFQNQITYNDMLKTSLLIAFWSWSWSINMLPNQLSKLALMEFNILKAKPFIPINKWFTTMFGDRVVSFLWAGSVMVRKVPFPHSIWWDTVSDNMSRTAQTIEILEG